MTVKWVAYKTGNEGDKSQRWLDLYEIRANVLYSVHKEHITTSGIIFVIDLPNNRSWSEWNFYVNEVLTTEGIIPTEAEKGIANMMGYKFYIEEQHSDQAV